MLHFLSSVHQSMLSCRRRQPIPQDFSYALSQHNLTPSSLIPHLQPPVPPSLSEIWLEPAPQAEATQPDILKVLGPSLSGAVEKDQNTYIPSHFPAFPSKHTYKSTPEFTEREQSPRAVRERATEEGRLGEEALRRLVNAGKAGENRHNRAARGKGSGGPRQKMEEMWLQTMIAMSQEQELRTDNVGADDAGQHQDLPSQARGRNVTPQKLEVGAVVNCEKTYWRAGPVRHQPRLPRNSTAVEDADSLINKRAPLMAL